MSAITLPAAGTKIAVTVTAEHIARGRPCMAGECPIALAILDAVPGAAGADVWPGPDLESGAYARVWAAGFASAVPLLLGHEALDFIRHFDTGTAVEPAVFEAEAA